MPTQIARRRFTVEEYYRMAEAGILGPGDRVELIGGEVIEKVTIGPRPAACVRALSYALQPALGARAIVQVQSPVRLGSYDVPEPDVAVLRPPLSRYRVRHPEPGDTLLVVEVADSTLELDREVKLPLYARAGIPEAWLVDLDGEVVEAYRVPARRGYRESRRLDRDTTVALHAFPDVELAVRVFFE
jgi:Uma2 family endonuclease